MPRLFYGKRHLPPSSQLPPRHFNHHARDNAWNNRFAVLDNEVYDPASRLVSRGPRQRPRPTGNASDRQPQRIPPEFFALTRDHFVIIKSIHHRATLRDGLPPSLLRKQGILSASVNPAFNNDYFAASVETITAQWGSAILQALREHYEHLISAAVDHISKEALPVRVLDDSLKLVLKWARAHLGRKLLDDELDEALSLIREKQLLTSESLLEEQTTREAFPSPRRPETESSGLHKGTQTSPPEEPENEEDLQPLIQATSMASSEAVPSTDSGHESSEDASIRASQSNGPLRQTQLQSFTSFSLPPVSEAPVCTNLILDGAKSNVIFGDSNLQSFAFEDCSILASSKGRLSFFKHFLQTNKDVYENVSNFVFCLSHLDNRNKTATNFTTFKGVMYNARRVFPNARIFVLLNCLTT